MDKLKRHLWHKSSNSWIQFFRYAVVAGIGLVFDFGGLYGLTQYAHLNYLVSATISFLVALIVNYLLSMWWVFPLSSYGRWHEFGVFGAIGLVGLGLNDLFIWIFTAYFGLFYLVSKAIATIVVFLWNFLARKAYFAKAPKKEPVS